MNVVGQSVPRIEGPDKVTGRAMYTNDLEEPGLLYAWMATSLQRHAVIRRIDTSEAEKAPGVQAVVTGRDYPYLTGPVLEDRPVLAFDRVRYFGEPIALVVANSEHEAKWAASLIKVEYEPLPVLDSASAALQEGAALIHENLGQYKKAVDDVYPELGTNIAHHLKIRKGDMQSGWSASEVVVEESTALPQSDHAAMETRAAKTQIRPDGRVLITSSTQTPVMIKTIISRYFHVDLGKIIVSAPLVGGAYGGKTPVQLELLAYLASRAAGGRLVKIVNTREQDIGSSPVQIGFEARVKLGARRDGRIVAAEMTYLIDTGAYTDTGPVMTKAVAANGTGPYGIPNVHSDVLCVYTNHTFVTAFRGFGHTAYTFAIERTMDKLALALGMDPLELRLRNAIAPGDSAPTLVPLNSSNVGNLRACIEKLRGLIHWDEGMRIEIGDGNVRAKGMSCFWKTSSSPTDAISGAVLSMNADGTINLECGAAEMGQGTKTGLAQILAEKMGMRADQIYPFMPVGTLINPEQWKTVASMSTYMAGRAVLEAADELIEQLKSMAAIVLRCPPSELEVGGGRVYMKSEPDTYIEMKEIAHGYKYPNGNAIGGQIMGKGSFIMPHLTSMDRETGQGKTGPGWTVGAQAVEVEYDTRDHRYRLLKAATVLDAGKVVNPMIARGQVMGAMKMGLSYASREALTYNERKILETSFRTYKTIRFGETPEYLVEFVETPEVDAPYGERGLGEEGILGMPAALANALSSAAQVDLCRTPIIPEYIWRAKGGAEHNSIRDRVLPAGVNA